MKKLASILVDKRYLFLAIVLVIAVVSGFLIPKVGINKDMTKYLPADSSMKQGLDIMQEEFPDTGSGNNIRVMFTGLTEEQEQECLLALQSIESVDSVSYDESDSYHKGEYTLYVLNISCEYDSAEERSIHRTLEEEFSGYEMCYRNSDTNEDELPLWVIAFAVVMLIVILLIMSASWFEPVIFILVIGLAVLINMGTNLVLGSIASITFSISAILQVVLSMDYSIILMNRYRQERKRTDDKIVAMKYALENSFGSIFGSAFTTIVGLLILLFMSFTIGFNLGIALAKGVTLSLLCVITVSPSLTILCDKLILKSEKKLAKKAEKRAGAREERNHPAPSGVMAAAAYKGRFGVLGVFAVVFVGVCILQSFTPVNYTVVTEDPISDVFPSENTIVMIYDNEDEERVAALSEGWRENESVSAITSYGELFGREYTAQEMNGVIAAAGMSMNESLVRAVYYLYFDGSVEPVQAETVFAYLSELSESGMFDAILTEELKENVAMLTKFSDREALLEPKTSEEIAEFFGMDPSQVSLLFLLYGSSTGSVVTEMSVQQFVDYAAEVLQGYPGMADEETVAQLALVKNLVGAVVSDETYSPAQMSALLGGAVEENTMEALYLLLASAQSEGADQTLSIQEFVGYIADSLLTDPRFAGFIGEDMQDYVGTMREQLEEGVRQMRGARYSRLIFTTSLPAESEETTTFFKDLTAQLDQTLQGEYHLIGSSAMNYEMSLTFGDELLLITVLTIVAIFLVVSLSFRNPMIALLLVALVQCGVYITVSVLHGFGVYYLALLIVEAILMGATIDYGILFTNYYREYRKILPPRQAIGKAYGGAVHTILTSGMILVLITGMIGLMTSETLSQICLAVSIGALSAAVLVLFVLPSLLAIFDKAVVFTIGGKKKGKERKMSVLETKGKEQVSSESREEPTEDSSESREEATEDPSESREEATGEK